MPLQRRQIADLAYSPEGLGLQGVSLRSFGVEGDFLVEVDVVGEHEDLLDAALAVRRLRKQPLDQGAHDEQDVAIQAGHWVVNDHYPVRCDAAGRRRALHEMIEVEESDETALPFAQGIARVGSVASDDLVKLLLVASGIEFEACETEGG